MNKLGTYTMFKRELVRIKEVWKQAVLAPAVTNVLFLLIFGVAIAGRATSFEGIDYMSILIPGLVAMGLLINSMQNPLFSIILSKYTNNIGELLKLPLTGFEIALAFVAGGIMRGAMVGAATLVVGLFFAPVPFESPLLILLFTILIGGTFASLGAILGVISNDFDKANIVPTFVITPLTYLGGVFYSIQALPPLFQTISRFNPIFYMIDGFRYGFLGVGDVPIAVSLGVTIAIFLVTFGLVSWIFQTGYKLQT